jgi:(S)-2-hydroxy-acid oxidase
MKDRDRQLDMVRRAEAAGCVAVLLTADSPVLGVRHNERRNGFRTPAGLAFPMLGKTADAVQAETHDGGFDAFNSPAHSWERDVAWLRRASSAMQVWVKGVLTADDVELAVRHGCDGVIVSNHGGRQLDETPATIDVLAAAGRIPVHVDGGIRSGADMFKALALGAQCVWIGRPVLWGLAVRLHLGPSCML